MKIKFILGLLVLLINVLITAYLLLINEEDP